LSALWRRSEKKLQKVHFFSCVRVTLRYTMNMNNTTTLEELEDIDEAAREYCEENEICWEDRNI